jgi:hypothetical protein
MRLRVRRISRCPRKQNSVLAEGNDFIHCFIPVIHPKKSSLKSNSVTKVKSYLLYTISGKNQANRKND